MLDESKCITDPKSYSVLIEVKLDSVAGDNAIMTSEEWFDDGLYVADEVFQMRPSAELRCAAEPIRAGYTYKFAVTRNKKTGQVSLYMNGYKCASGIPRSDSGFALEPNNMAQGPGSPEGLVASWAPEYRHGGYRNQFGKRCRPHTALKDQG